MSEERATGDGSGGEGDSSVRGLGDAGPDRADGAEAAADGEPG
jgi:hypothetical protein